MAEEKKTTTATTSKPSTETGKSADKPAARPAARTRSLLPAAESSDPAVHQLLAELQTARSNDNDGEVDRLTDKLADLGYE